MNNVVETPAERNKTVLFRNFSDKVFSSVKPHEVKGGQTGGTMMIVDENCKWAGEDYTFEPGEARYMPKWKAEHFARHLVNRELVRKGMDNDTSPKRPADNVRYMELFRQAVIEDPSAVPLTEAKSEEEVMNLNKDMEIAALRAENERLKNGGVTPVVPVEEPQTVQASAEAEPEKSEELITPAETEEDEEFADPINPAGPENPERPQGYAPGETPAPFDPGTMSTGAGSTPGTGTGGTALNTGE